MSTFPPCIFSRELMYGVYLPYVVNQSIGMTQGWYVEHTFLRNGPEYPHEGCNCTFPPPYVLSREASYGVYMPSVLTKVEG